MGSEQELLVSLLVKIAVVAAAASILLRWSFAKRMLLRERRTARQRLELGAFFGIVFALGTLVRLVLGYDAAEIGLEAAFVCGLVGGYVTGPVAGGVIALPAVLYPQSEWITLPLLVGVGALGGLLRDFAPGPDEIWRFSPFFPFTIPAWLFRSLGREHAFQMLLLLCCLAIELLRTSLAQAFAGRGWLFALHTVNDDLSAFSIVLVYFSTVVSVGVMIKVWNNTRNEWKLEEQQRLLIEARLENLTSQINPHFLFNTLNSVASLIRFDPDTARQLIFKLSTILRRLLRQHDAFAPLREELSFIDDYLQIEQVRFGDKLRIHKEIDPEALTALVPSMLLQPIVENSIKHGLGPKIGVGSIWLRSQLRGERLLIEVEDDGVGISEEAMATVFQSGIGVSNVHERLVVLFGADFHMTLERRPAGGTRTRIQIPLLSDPSSHGAVAEAQPEAIETPSA